MAQHRPTGCETTPPYTPRSSRFGSELPSVEDRVDIWCYTVLELHARNDDDDQESAVVDHMNARYHTCIIIDVKL